MQRFSPKNIIIFFVNNLVGTFYIIPLWWLGVYIFSNVWNPHPLPLPKTQILLLLNGAGIIYLIVLILGSYFWAWISYLRYVYSLESDGLHITKGVFFQKQFIIVYTAIQDVQVYANPFISRLLGLYYLHLQIRPPEETNKKKKVVTQMQLPGLSAEEVQNLRGTLINTSHILPSEKKYFDPATGTYH